MAGISNAGYNFPSKMKGGGGFGKLTLTRSTLFRGEQTSQTILTIVQHIQLHAELSVSIRTTKLTVASLLLPPLASTSAAAADRAFSDSLEMRHTGNWCV